MSKIYRRLNELDVELDELEVEVTAIEKQRAKQVFRKSISNQNRKINRLTLSAVAVVAFFILGYSFPAVASQIPIIGGIFGQFETAEFEGLDELASPVGLSHSMDGLTVGIESVVFDGKNVVISWSMLFEESVGFNEFMSFSHHVYGGLVIDGHGGWMVERVSENEFIGWTQWELFNDVTPSATVGFDIRGFGTTSVEDAMFESWKHTFNFELTALEGEHIVLTDLLTSVNNGIEIAVYRLEQTPALTRLFIDMTTLEVELHEWESINIEWLIEDDLGNEIVNFLGSSLGLDFFSLSPNAKQLILTPRLAFSYYTYSEEVYEEDMRPRYMLGNVGEKRELSPIIIDLP
jgi:hypothetical protein